VILDDAVRLLMTYIHTSKFRVIWHKELLVTTNHLANLFIRYL